MLTLTILLFTHIEMIEAARMWLPIFISAGVFLYTMKKSNSKELESKLDDEKKRTEARLLEIEKSQDKNIPKFFDLISDVKHINDTVNNAHELRFRGIVSDIERLRDNYDLRFSVNEKTMDNISCKLDDLETKIDKNAEVMSAKVDKIFDILMKMQAK
ncbi:hypothetical protein [Hymenobacter sp. APR13]|uniref:hypothetical protein n=1 Tax=Hymenobacter sp. APR13 TaxID=1356852 RepID=UPI0004E0491F|nr:hypothetical protein [Hymenobacter sp. APR13]AII50388.1 hypothetical protein N008_00120 [Hymenobacter sp. APR13]